MMVVTSMYTANLAASLTVNNMDIGIKSVKDLLAQVRDYHSLTVRLCLGISR